MEFSRDRNSVSSLQAHLVFVTKYRRKILTQESSRLIEESFQSVAKGNSLKGVSSRKYGQAKLPKPYGKAALWSPSYFVSSVGGAPLKVL